MTAPTSLAMPGQLIRRLHQHSTQVFAAAMAEAGEDLTPVQFAMLDALAEAPGMDQATLARLIGKDRATVGSVAERLARKGLIARVPSIRDRRAILLALTADGAALHARLSPRVRGCRMTSCRASAPRNGRCSRTSPGGRWPRRTGLRGNARPRAPASARWRGSAALRLWAGWVCRGRDGRGLETEPLIGGQDRRWSAGGK